MSDQFISQDEIDALLRGSSTGGGPGDFGGSSPSDAGKDESARDGAEPDSAHRTKPDSSLFNDVLTAGQKDNLLRFTDEYFGNSLNIIETILGISVQILNRSVDYVVVSDLLSQEHYWCSKNVFSNTIWGNQYFLISEETAISLSALIMGKTIDEVGKEALLMQAYNEMITQIFGTSVPMLQNFFGGIVEGIVETVFSSETEKGLTGCEDYVYAAVFEIHVESLGNGKFIVVFPRTFIDENKSFFQDARSAQKDEASLVEESLDEQIDINELEKVIGELEKRHGVEEKAEPVHEPQIPAQQPQQQAQFQRPQQQPQQKSSPSAQQQQQQFQQQQQQQFQQQTVQSHYSQQGTPYQQQFSNATIQPVEFAEIPGNTGVPREVLPSNIDLLLDVPLDVTVELGRTKKKIREILDLGVGSVVELDKLAGESVDLLVNDNLIAKGEVVVIDENFGIRITTIVSPQERLERLK